MNPINPELLAAKIQAARNGEPEATGFAKQLAAQPLLLETLWFIQEMSRRPGGRERFVQNLIEAFPDRFQTSGMIAAGPPDKAGRWTLDQCLTAWQDEAEPIRYAYADSCRAKTTSESLDSMTFHDWLYAFIGPEVSAKDARGGELLARALRTGLARFNFDFFKKLCIAEVKAKLPDLLWGWCESPSYDCDAPSFFPDLLPTLCHFLDRHATEAARELAATEFTKIVFRELEFAYSQRVPVPIIGLSRFGKTKAVNVWCEMRPGQRRLVTVPDSSRERDFFTAHADAFGIEYGVSTTTARLRRQVEFVHRQSGLFLVYDEAHFLVPVSYHRGTPPRRLNWIRCQVIDRELGCAFFATPQSYRETLDAYVKTTGYCMEQWLGRLAPAVVLPESLDSADVLAVARNHFPDVPEPYLKLISARAMQSEGYLKNMEITVKRACFLAGERGHRAPTLADVQEAIDYMMPGADLAAGKPSATDLQPARHAPAKRLQPACRGAAALPEMEIKTEFSRRGSMVMHPEPEPALAG